MVKCYPAHPRRCGENHYNVERLALHTGSSPQVRGKLFAFIKEYRTQRLIPAGAGKTFPNAASAVPMAAHPRRCGENQQP